MAQNPAIVIVGSGAAGYAAACKLLENNYTNITVLEAGNRIGGRVHSVPFGNGLVDLGAQWCHGEDNNPVYNLVKDLNLLGLPACDYTEYIFMDSSGNLANPNTTKMLINLLVSISDDEGVKDYPGSYGKFIEETFETKLNTDHPGVDRNLAKLVLGWFHKIQNVVNASSNWYEISAKAAAKYVDCDGNQALNWKDKGYITLFSVLNKEIPNPRNKLPIDNNILLNKEVNRINWNKSINNNKVIIDCTDGSQYKADHVIVTVSLGVLKHLYTSLFEPELPVYKRNAIEGLTFGCLMKVLLKFPQKWWKGHLSCGFNMLWKEQDQQNIINEFPEGPNKDGRSWLTAFDGFHPVDSNPNILLGFASGEFCKQIELISDDILTRGCMYLMRKFCGKYGNIPEPDAILRSSWVSNEHVRGAYSFHSLKADSLQTNNGELAKPLGNNALLFAGEATHPIFSATVHGAIETGFREANRIIAHYKQ